MRTRLVILAPNWLGDAVMALPAIADVRRAWPDATIVVAARPSVAPLFTLVDGVDAHITLPASLADFDVALLLPNAFRPALMVWRAGVPERWGYRADGRGMLLTRSIPRPAESIHQIAYYQRLVAALGFANDPTAPRVTVSDDVRAAGARLLTAAGWDGRTALVALAPGAAYGSAKRWPPEYFAALAADLARDGVQSVVVGSAADAAIAAHVSRAFPGLLDITGRTDLPTLAGVLVHCRTLVTNDSGAMHLAAAAGVAVTAVFGPTRDRETHPIGERHAMLTHDTWCRPCMLRDCPLDHRCMLGVTPAEMAASTRRTLDV
jgi:lipopolysaccharide heptosyltransferase II